MRIETKIHKLKTIVEILYSYLKGNKLRYVPNVKKGLAYKNQFCIINMDLLSINLDKSKPRYSLENKNNTN